jgi:hypothetical protein
MAIIARIGAARRRVRRFKLILSGAASVLSCTLFAFSAVRLGAALSGSGIGSYLSLVLSEGVAEGFGALSYIRELSLALLESLPVAASMAVCAALAASLWSVQRFLRQARPAGRQSMIAA